MVTPIIQLLPSVKRGYLECNATAQQNLLFHDSLMQKFVSRNSCALNKCTNILFMQSVNNLERMWCRSHFLSANLSFDVDLYTNTNCSYIISEGKIFSLQIRENIFFPNIFFLYKKTVQQLRNICLTGSYT